jgi:hypothetical protein
VANPVHAISKGLNLQTGLGSARPDRLGAVGFKIRFTNKTGSMDRRSALRCFFVSSAGIVLLPSCLQDKKKPPIVWKNMDISGEQEDSLADLAATIIPTTSSPGARDISAHLFALTMVDDCCDKTAQKQFVNGLGQFETLARNKYGHSFAKCTKPEKEELLNAIEKKEGVSEEVASFYHTMKKYTIQSFVSSQYFLTKVHVYEMVPARFHGCVAVTKTN